MTQSNFACDDSFVKVKTSFTSEPISSLTYLVKKLSRGTLKIEDHLTPYSITGDFNFDTVQDVAVIVRLSEKLENVKKIIDTQNPYSKVWGEATDNVNRGVLIVHGKNKSWEHDQLSSVLLLGRNAVISFTEQNSTYDGKAIFIQHDSKGRDLIVLPTEAAVGTLMWYGSKYKWEEESP